MGLILNLTFLRVILCINSVLCAPVDPFIPMITTLRVPLIYNSSFLDGAIKEKVDLYSRSLTKIEASEYYGIDECIEFIQVS